MASKKLIDACRDARDLLTACIIVEAAAALCIIIDAKEADPNTTHSTVDCDKTPLLRPSLHYACE